MMGGHNCQLHKSMVFQVAHNAGSKKSPTILVQPACRVCLEELSQSPHSKAPSPCAAGFSTFRVFSVLIRKLPQLPAFGPSLVSESQYDATVLSTSLAKTAGYQRGVGETVA